MEVVASLLIVMLFVFLPALMIYWLWVYKKSGLVVLLGVFMCGALEAHSIIYPQQKLKEKYAKLIG